MLKDHQPMADEPTSKNKVKKIILHILGVIAISIPGALVLFSYVLFGVRKEELQIILDTLAVCLVAGILVVFTGKFWLAYVVALIPVPALYLAAILSSGPITRKWTEDVLLDDGSTIQVQRMVTFNESNSVSGDSYNAVESDATISFTGELANLSPWRAPLMALVMYQDKETKEWVVVAISSSCEVWNRRGRPRPPYWEFRLSDNSWREVPLSSSSIGRSGNLLHRYQKELGTKHITVEGRKEREVPGRPFKSMSPTEKTFWVVLETVDPFNCG